MAKVNIPNRARASKAQIKAERAVVKALSTDPEVQILHRRMGDGPGATPITLDHFYVIIPGRGRFLLRVSLNPNQQPGDEREAAIASVRLERRIARELGHTPSVIPVVVYPHNGPTHLGPAQTMPNLF